MYDTMSAVLEQEQAVMDQVLASQQEIRTLVRDKQWPDLEAALHQFSTLTERFNDLEKRRTKCLDEAGVNAQGDFFLYINTLQGEEKRRLTERFVSIRRTLAASRAENRALHDYLRVMQDFLRGIFERAVPNRRAKVYTPQGVMANQMPTRLVVDCRG
jgi:flagellar biosynthesis/type III secretory pathway chaperone